ncbi:MAG TPA: hypothetical protein VMV49_08350 [Candidatus Deferrimicrobium sp.]|nr:hypothetical protein [Candidatus Deferrimicrobium sp.]
MIQGVIIIISQLFLVLITSFLFFKYISPKEEKELKNQRKILFKDVEKHLKEENYLMVVEIFDLITEISNQIGDSSTADEFRDRADGLRRTIGIQVPSASQSPQINSSIPTTQQAIGVSSPNKQLMVESAEILNRLKKSKGESPDEPPLSSAGSPPPRAPMPPMAPPSAGFPPPRAPMPPMAPPALPIAPPPRAAPPPPMAPPSAGFPPPRAPMPPMAPPALPVAPPPRAAPPPSMAPPALPVAPPPSISPPPFVPNPPPTPSAVPPPFIPQPPPTAPLPPIEPPDTGFEIASDGTIPELEPEILTSSPIEPEIEMPPVQEIKPEVMAFLASELEPAVINHSSKPPPIMPTKESSSAIPHLAAPPLIHTPKTNHQPDLFESFNYPPPFEEISSTEPEDVQGKQEKPSGKKDEKAEILAKLNEELPYLPYKLKKEILKELLKRPAGKIRDTWLKVYIHKNKEYAKR